MKVAVTVWEERISPVFDASRRLLVAEIRSGQIANRSYMAFDPGEPTHLAKTLSGMDVHVLICGAISQVPATLMTDAGITLIPFIAGEVDQVMGAYAKGDALSPTFSMPGCKNVTTGTHSSF